MTFTGYVIEYCLQGQGKFAAGLLWRHHNIIYGNLRDLIKFRLKKIKLIELLDI